MTSDFRREPHPVDAILPTLTGITTIVEIGCHRLEDTAFLRQTFPKARIIAFEPDPRNVAIVVGQELDWRYDVDLFELAVGDRSEVREFWQSTNFAESADAEWSRSGSLRRPRSFGDEANVCGGIAPCVFKSEPVKVACVRLDTFFDDLGLVGPVDLLWIDAQGAEDLIIAGAPKTLSGARWLFIEHNTDGCYDGAPDLAKLSALLPDWEPLYVWSHDALFRRKRP
jgi:FkbM family methyltransferase